MSTKLFSLEGKVCVVTGGNQGIGKVVAKYIASAGADIVILDVTDASGVVEDIAKEYGVRSKSYICDVTDSKAVVEVIDKASSDMGTLDLLFNNAGICMHKPLLECEPSDWHKVMDVNVNGVYFVAHTFAKYLVEHGKTGNIVNMASMSATIVNIPQGQTSYNSSKAAVKHMTKSFAVELADKGIRVNSLSPGYIKTEMTGYCDVDWQKFWIDSTPFKRMGNPEELAGAVIYLLSDASTFTSGSDLIVDGCFTIV